MGDSYGVFTCKLAPVRRWRAAVPSARHRAHNPSARWSDSPPWRPKHPSAVFQKNSTEHNDNVKYTNTCRPGRTDRELSSFCVAVFPVSRSTVVLVRAAGKGSNWRESVGMITHRSSVRSFCLLRTHILLGTVPSDTCVTTVSLSDYKGRNIRSTRPLNIYFFYI